MELNKIYNEDVLVYLKRLDDLSVDLAVHVERKFFQLE